MNSEQRTKAKDLSLALLSWAHNEEMIDQYFTRHGEECVEAAALLDSLATSDPTPLPSPDHLRILWQVAVTSSLEGHGEPYAIFARMLREDLFGIDHPYKLYHYPNSNDPDETPDDAPH